MIARCGGSRGRKEATGKIPPVGDGGVVDGYLGAAAEPTGPFRKLDIGAIALGSKDESDRLTLVGSPVEPAPHDNLGAFIRDSCDGDSSPWHALESTRWMALADAVPIRSLGVPASWSR